MESSSPELTAIDRCTEKLTCIIKLDPLGIAVKLISHELLPHSIAEKMRLPGVTDETKAVDLVASIRTLVAACPEKFNTIVEILMEEAWLKDVSETLSSTYSECLQELKTKQKPTDSVGATTSDVATTTPERDPDSVAHGDDAPVDINSPKLTVEAKITVFKKRFTELVMKAVAYFVNQEAKDPGFLSSFRLGVAFLPDLRQLLPSTFPMESILEAKSASLILGKYSKYWDYLNCDVLQEVVSNFGDSNLKMEMKQYTRDLQKFCSMTNVFHFPAWEFSIPPDFSTIVAKFKINAQECTIAHVLEYRQKIADCSVLQPPDIRLAETGPGSVIMTLALPRILTTLFVKSFDWNNKSAEDIEELRVDDLQLVEYQHLLKCPIPLIVAARQGFTEVTKTLLANKSDVNIQDEDGATPLSCAVANGHLSTSQLLVEAGADVTIQNNSGATPLWRACSRGNTAIAALLIDHGANVNRPRADDVGNPPLVQTSFRGHLDTVKLLIDRGAHVNGQNKDGDTPLILASQEGHKDIVEVLLNHGAEFDLPNNNGDTPLWSASADGRTDVARLLIDRGANVNQQTTHESGNYPLTDASANGHVDTVKLLIDRGAKVNAQNKDGVTPLSLASQEGHKDIVEVLLNHGAEVDLQSRSGLNAVMAAVLHKHTDIGLMLLQAPHIIVNMKNKNGLTALIMAARDGNTAIARALLGINGVAVNIQEGTAGWSALFFACERGHLEIVNLLLNAGADTTLIGKSGDTALDVATVHKREEVVAALEQHASKKTPSPTTSLRASGETESKQEPTQEEEDEKKKEEHGRQSSEGDKDNQPLEHTPTDEDVESVGIHPPPDSDKTGTPPSDKLGGHSEKSTSTPETPTTSGTTLSRLERMRQRILKTSKQLTEVFARVIQETALRQQAEKRTFLESNKRASEKESQQGVELEYLPEVIEPPRY